MNGKRAGGLSNFIKSQLASTEAPNVPSHDVTDSETTELTEFQTLKVTDSVRSRDAQDAPLTRIPRREVRSRKVPLADTEYVHFEEFERKEARLRAEQFSALGLIERRLSSAKRGRGQDGPRVTANTLIRVAVDLLLEHADELSSLSESELLTELRRLVRKR